MRKPSEQDRRVAARSKGRGATSNPQSRFDHWTRVAEPDGWGPGEAESGLPRLATRLTLQAARSILTSNESPDVPFDRSINPYRGCEHGCIYCYARPSHATLGLSPGLDFESRLFAKTNAPELLQAEFRRAGYVCQPVALGVNTDAYQPVERRLALTRRILDVLRDCGHPVTIITKSALVLRDLDLLRPMAAAGLARVDISITTLDHDLARHLEPRASSPTRRLEVISALRSAGIPCGVMVAPVIPFLTDAQLESTLEAASAAGATIAGYVLLRLPLEVFGLFEDWLRTHHPLKADHVLARLRGMRGGRNNDPAFGSRMRGQGVMADLLVQRFEKATRRLGLSRRGKALDTTRFRPPPLPGQLSLF